MFSYIKNAIDKITISSSQWVFGENKFTRERKFSFNDYVTFFTCNKGLSNRCDLEDYIEDSLNRDFSHYSRQALSKQRTFINPLVFKEINKQYLKEINYTGNNSFFLRILKDFVFLQVMDRILNFQIFQKYEKNLKLMMIL